VRGGRERRPRLVLLVMGKPGGEISAEKRKEFKTRNTGESGDGGRKE